MKYIRKTLSYIIIFTALVFAQDKQQYANIGNLKLESGKAIIDCVVGYRTFGKLDSEKSNAIIFPTWFQGTSKQMKFLVGKAGSFLDSTKFYIIAIDALGNGISSSPSNSKVQPNEQFPKYTIRDMVNSQYKLLTECLDIPHLYGAVGGSMGSMQVLEWAVAYPNYIDKILPYAAAPRRSSYGKLWHTTELTIIEQGRKAGMKECEIIKELRMVQTLLMRTPNNFAKRIKPSEFESYAKVFDEPQSPNFPVINWESQVRAMYNFDISKLYNYSFEETAKHIKAEILLIVSPSDHLVNCFSAVEFAKVAKCKILILDSDCGHIIYACKAKEMCEASTQFFYK